MVLHCSSDSLGRNLFVFSSMTLLLKSCTLFKSREPLEMCSSSMNATSNVVSLGQHRYLISHHGYREDLIFSSIAPPGQTMWRCVWGGGQSAESAARKRCDPPARESFLSSFSILPFPPPTHILYCTYYKGSGTQSVDSVFSTFVRYFSRQSGFLDAYTPFTSLVLLYSSVAPDRTLDILLSHG
jgi:hypothetical protein